MNLRLIIWIQNQNVIYELLSKTYEFKTDIMNFHAKCYEFKGSIPYPSK